LVKQIVKSLTYLKTTIMKMLPNLDKYTVILASNSPRRHELLTGLGIDYSIKVLPDIEETYPSSMPAAEIPCHLSRQKAAAYSSEMRKDELIITADTIVSCQGTVLGKPTDIVEAKEMLHFLSGKKHEVITGVSLTTTTFQQTFSATTTVYFDALSDEVIDYYVNNFRPFDKAGAYGIQEWIGYMGIKRIEGSYFNVMGLPVQQLFQVLKEID